MGLMDNIKQRIRQFLDIGDEWANTERRERLVRMETYGSYYAGDHRRQLKTKPGGPDDNIVLNYAGLIIDRAVSMLTGGGVRFVLPGENDGNENQQYIDDVWDANRHQLTIHDAAQYAAIHGTGYLKILPDGIVRNDRNMPRIVALDPRWMSIETDAEDVNTITAYESRFSITRDGETVARKERVVRQTQDIGGFPVSVSWVVENYEAGSNGRWELIESVVWPFDFPPIVHWQNLPMAGSPYGESDIGDVIELQDRINYTASNISKILRYHAHPKTWGRGATMGNRTSWGPDEMVWLSGDNSALANLEMQSDLVAAREYLLSLRQSLFDISRTVDITSLNDKLGALTNFGLRVLYTDSIFKIQTKQQMMGDALAELNRRLLVLDNRADTDPGEVVWPDNVPTNELEMLQAAQLELGVGLVSKQTLAGERGRDWEIELERIEDESASKDNVGAQLLRAFNNGQ